MTDRTPRANKTREKTVARKPWAPPSMLDAPPAPDGFKHRWIRSETRGLTTLRTLAQKCAKVGNLFVRMNTLTLSLR